MCRVSRPPGVRSASVRGFKSERRYAARHTFCAALSNERNVFPTWIRGVFPNCPSQCQSSPDSAQLACPL